jgi:hypothetical protein
MYRIYFDSNEADADGRENLGIPGSLKDIEPIASELKDGIRVLLYDFDRGEVEAILEYDGQHHRWMARPIWETFREIEDHSAKSLR